MDEHGRSNLNIGKVFRRAAKLALHEWKNSEDGLEDLVNDLWVWYLERVSARELLSSVEYHEAVNLVKDISIQILSGGKVDDNLFSGKNVYAVNSLKEELSWRSSNKYIKEILPRAFEKLQKDTEEYAEAIVVRYWYGIVPKQGSDAVRLTRALKSLTDNINLLAIDEGSAGINAEGAGSKDVVFPGAKKPKGDHSDPTATAALSFEKRPEFRAEYLTPTDKDEFLGGAGASLVLDLGDGRRYRATGQDARLLKRHQDLVEPYIQKVKQRC